MAIGCAEDLSRIRRYLRSARHPSNAAPTFPRNAAKRAAVPPNQRKLCSNPSRTPARTHPLPKVMEANRLNRVKRGELIFRERPEVKVLALPWRASPVRKDQRDVSWRCHEAWAELDAQGRYKPNAPRIPLRWQSIGEVS